MSVENLPYPMLEFILDEDIILDVTAFYKLNLNELRKLSIYQILFLYIGRLREENKILALLETLKMWVNPQLYAEVSKKTERRINEFFDETLENLRQGIIDAR